MTAPHDPGYCYRQRQAIYRRRRLAVVVFACALVLAGFGLASTGPSDAHVEGNGGASR